MKKVNADSVATTPEDIDQLRKVGWTDEAIYDAITVCALFNFYNVWIDATGVSDMPGHWVRDVRPPLGDRGVRANGEQSTERRKPVEVRLRQLQLNGCESSEMHS